MNTDITKENFKYSPGTGDIRLRIKATAKRPFPLFYHIMFVWPFASFTVMVVIDRVLSNLIYHV